MKTKISDEEFLDYVKYAKYHEQFNRNGLSEDNQKLLPQLLNRTTTDVSIQNKFKHIIKILLNYLSNAGIFYYDSPKACSYISYVLSKEVHTMTGEEYTEHTYQIFKNFVDKYNSSLGAHSDRCKRELVKIGYDRYMQMKALYQLYDKYTPLSNRNLVWGDYNCDGLTHLVHLYNSFLYSYESGSKNFNTILEHFQGLMNNIVLRAKPDCPGRNLALSNPDLFVPEIIPPPPPSEGVSNQSQRDTLHETGKSKPSEVTRLPTSAVGEELGEIPQNLKGPEVSDPLTSTTTLFSQKAVEEEHPHRTLDTYEQQNFLRMPKSYMSHDYHVTNSTLPEEDSTFKPTRLKEQGLINEDISVLGKIKTTLSGIVSEVEPAPILGVSGGMGVLFILFKYTPVRSFFGGRRGRNLRIPSGFPGAYPGFPEYYDGNFGNMPINISYQAE